MPSGRGIIVFRYSNKGLIKGSFIFRMMLDHIRPASLREGSRAMVEETPGSGHKSWTNPFLPPIMVNIQMVNVRVLTVTSDLLPSEINNQTLWEQVDTAECGVSLWGGSHRENITLDTIKYLRGSVGSRACSPHQVPGLCYPVQPGWPLMDFLLDWMCLSRTSDRNTK